MQRTQEEHFGETMADVPEMEPVHVTVISDAICPWCYVGKRKLDEAVRILRADGFATEIEWKPFLLNPDMPTGGADRKAYRTAKFGSWARSRMLDHQVASAGAEVGLAFDHQAMVRTPNTTLAHGLIAFARHQGGVEMQDRAVEALFRAYFVCGRDIGDTTALADVADEIGLDRAAASAALAAPGLAGAVRLEDAAAKALGVRGVPAFAAGGRMLASGAQDAGTLAAAIASVALAGRTDASAGSPRRVGSAR